mgnify:CR=1 FL=1
MVMGRTAMERQSIDSSEFNSSIRTSSRSPQMDISQFSLVVEQMQTCASQNIDGFDCFRLLLDMIEQMSQKEIPTTELIET